MSQDAMSLRTGLMVRHGSCQDEEVLEAFVLARRTRDGGCVSLYTDITQVKLGEQQRREFELVEKSILLQSTLDNLAQGVCVFDRSDRLALSPVPVPQNPVVCVMWTEQVTAAGLILEGRHSQQALNYLMSTRRVLYLHIR